MTIDLSTRRSIRKVTHADFAAYPVWEWAIDEENVGNGESFLRPTSLDYVPLGAEAHFVVSARTTLSDGTLLPSCLEVTMRKGKPCIEPMFVFLLDRHLDFAGVQTTAMLSRYTKRVNIFPVHWEMAVPLAGESALRDGSLRRSILARLAEWWRRLTFRRSGVVVH